MHNTTSRGSGFVVTIHRRRTSHTPTLPGCVSNDWQAYFESDQLPERPDPMGHVIVLIHKAISKLTASGCFDRLMMSSPFRVGAEFPRDKLGLVVMRLLNWPPHHGPRV